MPGWKLDIANVGYCNLLETLTLWLLGNAHAHTHNIYTHTHTYTSVGYCNLLKNTVPSLPKNKFKKGTTAAFTRV